MWLLFANLRISISIVNIALDVLIVICTIIALCIIWKRILR